MFKKKRSTKLLQVIATSSPMVQVHDVCADVICCSLVVTIQSCVKLPDVHEKHCIQNKSIDFVIAGYKHRDVDTGTLV